MPWRRGSGAQALVGYASSDLTTAESVAFPRESTLDAPLGKLDWEWRVAG